jgi:hypothetical protein
VVSDEELIEELSFPVYRRVSTLIFLPPHGSSSIEMVSVDPADLAAAAQERDHMPLSAKMDKRSILAQSGQCPLWARNGHGFETNVLTYWMNAAEPLNLSGNANATTSKLVS